MAAVTAIHLSCLCGAFRTSISVPESSLPLSATLCHCTTCRHVSGLLCTSYALLPSAPDALNGLVNYDTSPDQSRLFCGSCGAHVFVHQKSTAVWAVATGVLDRGAELVKFGSHVWVEDTLDGGLSDWLLEVDKQTILRWKQGYQTTTYLPWGDPLRSKRQKPTTTSGKLQATCHCQGVQFHITPPDENSSKASSPWSNLLTPYPSASSDNPDDVKWWLRDNGTKYLAGTCTCKSCRLSSGFDVQTWAFVPRFNLFRSNDLPLNFDIGTLRCYASSPGTFRDFCRVCGATVFWHSNKRPDLVDVSVGLLNAESGARAEEWLDWFTERVSFQEDALNKSLVEGLAKGLRVWGEQHNS